ncbi:LysR family transcriptional regulator [Roseovarius pelagicus]|uniref:LysR family transcriptional regulator n=1 Tax=Roseovarius pelagicus TaxID=2980108 RepID=A0ABY6D5V4_9RHOB|nr:LysR family transcriptional regulator [Roseovarius pelagicus]UXX81527.1 LysR family transcriptional regulator [Roseovarius pelagicus]
MNIVLAKTFLAVLEHRNFNWSAEVLNVTQSTVTMRINSLEEKLGQKLFLRSRSGVTPTVAGTQFRPFAEMLIQIWQQAQQEVTLPQGVTTQFRLGGEAGLWQGLVEDWILGITQSRNDLSLLIENEPADKLNACLAQGIYDAAVMYDARRRANVTVEFLFEENLVLVSTEPRERSDWHPEYTYIEWGPDFGMEHAKIKPEEITPPITINHGSWAHSWIKRKGGSAYFPTRMIFDQVENEDLFAVQNVATFRRSVWVSYNEQLIETEWFPPILVDLKRIAKEIDKKNAAFRTRWDLF